MFYYVVLAEKCVEWRHSLNVFVISVTISHPYIPLGEISNYL